MSKEIKVISWELPLARNNSHVDTPHEYLQKLSNASDGFYPMGTNSLWHGGIHLDGAHLTANSAIGCIANGEVIAYRVDKEYPTVAAKMVKSEPIQEGEEPTYQEEKARFSSGFVLVKHRLDMPSIETLAAQTTPVTGQETSQQQVPAEQSNEEIKPETDPTAAPTLTFYSLYMHLCHWPFYEANGELKRPAYWGDPTEFAVSEQAKDKISGCVVRENGAKSTKLAILTKGTVITVGGKHEKHQGWYKLESIDVGEALHIPPNTSAIGFYVFPGEMTQVAGNQYRVDKLPDSDGKLLGQSVYAKPEKSASLLLSVLPRGAKVQIGDKKGGWGKIAKLLTDKAYPALTKDDNGNSQGWVDLAHLKAATKPLKMDEVVVLQAPYPVKTGELMGYPGIYQELSVSDQPTDSPLLVHLEVFTPEEMPDFIQRTKARATQQTEAKKTLLKVNRDAVLYQVSTADKEIPHDIQLAKVDKSNAKGRWQEVKKERIGVVDKKYLSAYRAISQKPIKAEYTISVVHKQSVADALNIDLVEVPDKVFFYGQCLNSSGTRVTTTSPDKTYPFREIHFTPENDTASYWIEANKLDAKGKKVSPNQKISAWSQYPLQTDNKQVGKVYFEQVFANSEIVETEYWANDAQGTFWWQLKTGKKDGVIGTDSFGEVEGWVKNCTPEVTRHHPWEWPLFHTFQETATPAQELERNQRLRLDPADRTELMKALYKILGGTTRQVADTEEQQDAGLLSTENLKTGLRYPWLSQQFSHLIVNYESEWFADQGLSKWHELDKMLKKYLCPPQGETETAEAYEKRLEIELKPWQAEKEQRIKKLLWWDKVAGKHGFPVDAKVWHFHPVAFASHVDRISVTTFHIFWNDDENGRIEKHIVKKASEEFKNKYLYVYHDKNNVVHEIGLFNVHVTNRMAIGNIIQPDKIELVDVREFSGGYNALGVKAGFMTMNTNSERWYINPECFAGLLGAMLDLNADYVGFNGFSNYNAESVGGSRSHVNGIAGDLRYISINRNGERTILQDYHFDFDKQTDFNIALYKYGWGRDKLMYSESFTYNGVANTLLIHTRHMRKDGATGYRHHHHLHLCGFNESLIDIIEV